MDLLLYLRDFSVVVWRCSAGWLVWLSVLGCLVLIACCLLCRFMVCCCVLAGVFALNVL